MSSEKLDKKESKLPETWRNAADTFSVEELKAAITSEAARKDANERSFLDDPDVQQFKEKLDLASSGYKEIRTDCNLKLLYLVKVLKNKTT